MTGSVSCPNCENGTAYKERINGADTMDWKCSNTECGYAWPRNAEPTAPEGRSVQRLKSGEIFSVRVSYGPAMPGVDINISDYEKRGYRPHASELPDTPKK